MGKQLVYSRWCCVGSKFCPTALIRGKLLSTVRPGCTCRQEALQIEMHNQVQFLRTDFTPHIINSLAHTIFDRAPPPFSFLFFFFFFFDVPKQYNLLALKFKMCTYVLGFYKACHQNLSRVISSYTLLFRAGLKSGMEHGVPLSHNGILVAQTITCGPRHDSILSAFILNLGYLS